MNYFFNVKNKSPIPRTHPLLLSLTEVFKESEISPSLSSISEDDPRVLRSKYYTSPSKFPPLDVHLSGQNGVCPLFDPDSFTLTSVADCRECMLQHKAKGEQAQKTGSQKGGPPHPEQNPGETQEEMDEEALLCKFTVVCIQCYAHHTCRQLKAQTTVP